MEPLTRPDPDREWFQCFRRVDDSVFAGTDGPSEQCYAWVIQFTRRNWTTLLSVLESLSWPAPESVQVLVHDEEDDCFGLWMLHNGHLTEVPVPLTRRTPYAVRRTPKASPGC